MRKDDKMATQTLNTRIVTKCDTTTNWTASTLVLLKGEQAFEILESGVIKCKIGDGVKTFKELPYATMTPDEISALITSGAIQIVKLEPGTNNGTVALTVDGNKTDNIAVKGLGSAAYTSSGNYATAAQGTLATNAVRKVETGSANGTIAVTTGTGAAANVAVKGLGSAAYTASSNYATSAQGTKADNAMPKAGGTFTGAVTLNADPTANLHPATKQYVDTKISSSIAASDAMVFKGTIGTNGTSTALPKSAIVGDTYKVITQISIPAANSYTAADVTAKVGDLIVAMAKDPKWLVVPSGDEAVTTVNYSTTTTNLTTSAKTGSITLGEAATKQIDSTIATGSTSTKLPTSKAVSDFVATGLAGKSNTGHKHVKADITDFPTSMPASDVSAWAKASTKPTYTKAEVGLGNVDNTADANKSVKYATSAGSAGTATNVAGTAADTASESFRHVWFSDAGSETKRAYNNALKYDPKSNTITANISGNAATASSVAWGNVSGKPSTYSPSAHTHAIANITNLQTTLDEKAVSKKLSDQDLNDIIEPGFYRTIGGNTCKNKPDGINTFGLIVIQSAYGTYCVQILFNQNGKSYRRSCVDGTWSAWAEEKLTDTNTDTKVTNTLNTTTKAYITGTTSATTNTGTQVFDTGVYLGASAGELVATKFTGALSGNATTASSCSGNAGSATKLQTARNISITGGATAAAISFNGTGNVALNVTSLNTDSLVNGSNTLIFNCGGAA